MSKVATVCERLARYADEIETLTEQVGHWGEALGKALQGAKDQLSLAHEALKDWPANVLPPKKPATRSYEKLKVGDLAQVAERAEKNTPQPLRGKHLKVVAIEGDLVTVKLEEVQYGLAKKSLRPVEA